MKEVEKVRQEAVPKAEMSWRQPSVWRREYALEVKAQTVALLTQRGIINVETEIHEPDGLGNFQPVLLCRRTGILRQEIHVKSLDPRFPPLKPASLSLSGAARFVLPDGDTFHFGPENFWQSRWLLQQEDGTPLARFTRHTLGHRGDLLLYDNDVDEQTFLYLLYLSWYTLIVKIQDAAAAAAAA